ncbi:hypothetical protein [Pseudomonas aeruginosa]|uniref:hypothetical protein n=1 Tax=Pseudomonas aeruginosa TaxID=287 RepID=UPI000665D77B|nr:hypothetical protein [Pseudomonas aeruginosa]HBO3174903.1 hypothetical protein [Pseudomonas aeruginosa]HBO4702156.1 hypothetical protein [Pseudomonas aeruginosa]HCI1946358.1 hypothetical protein [Pseudomonas aeruginosa]HEP8420943.1 hypothetical protein [Pseudomonas aeruginosa]
MKITNVEWVEGAPEEIQRGMLIDYCHTTWLVGDGQFPSITGEKIARWAWLIKPQELAWLEDMANKHKARARG